ncbi:hypothetical protein QQS21_007739 [Conoideocrella luteorostrata]|uniref:Uncharacterized protein n=1 Tax=Conoideocrella luteorostrata TaxID=1105319 RepID=A0AAJ0FS51_9HYPO|nr:hypothetical protein QQS21_007739 [Conoideocrella luteorostrata]
MARRHQHHASYPPPLFVAELDTLPVHGSVASPEGGIAFEMPAEAAPARIREESGKRTARTAETGDTVQSNPWPFHLDQEVKSSSVATDGQHTGKDGEGENGPSKTEQANPWPYHGPVFGDEDNGPSATIYPTVQEPAETANRSAGKVAALSLDASADVSFSAEPSLNSQGNAEAVNNINGQLTSGSVQQQPTPGSLNSSYPAPLRPSRQNSAENVHSPIRPYCPPPERDEIAAGGIGSPTSSASKSPIQGPHGYNMPYRPYRPPSASSPTGTTIPQSPSVVGTAPHHFYMPFNPDSQPGSPNPEKKTSTFDTMAVLVPSEESKTIKGQDNAIGLYPPPATSTVASPPGIESSKQNVAAQVTAAASSSPPSQTPPPNVVSDAHAHLAQSPPGMTAVSPAPMHSGISHSPQIPPSPASSYNTHQPTQTPPPNLTPRPAPQQPPNYIPYSPPPAYTFPNDGRPESHLLSGQQQHPPYSPPPPSPYPTQPVYASTTMSNPPFPPSGKLPPPLPPRRQQIPYGGFGAGPSTTAAYPPPPKTCYNPAPPPYPPRPGSSSMSSGGSLFSASSAKKWFDKTSQVLESKLEAVLQGPPGPAYRPAYVRDSPPPQNYPTSHQQRGMPPPGYEYGYGYGYGYGPGPGPGLGPGPGPRPGTGTGTGPPASGRRGP